MNTFALTAAASIAIATGRVAGPGMYAPHETHAPYC